jgi:asparagine synthase (glutamine-hydrolysing)
LGDLPLLEDQYLNDRYDHPAERYRRKDFFNYLQGDILTKVDRAAMSASLEARAPFLDRDLIEFAYRIPMQHHMSPRPKELLRRVLSKYIPDSLVDRPKSGFAVPLADWLRGPLKDWAIESLSKEALPSYLNAESIGMVTNMHLSGKADLKYLLWDILIFQQWRRRYFDAH